MGLAVPISVTLAAATLDSKFCPLAPSPIRYQDNLGLRVINGQMSNQPLGAQVAARLVDTRYGLTIGWLYFDDDGNRYVVLKPHVDPNTYRSLGMTDFNRAGPDDYTEPLVKTLLRLPDHISVLSCSEL